MFSDWKNEDAGSVFSNMMNRQGVTPGGGQPPVGGFSPHPQAPHGWRGGMNGAGYPNPNQGSSFMNPYNNRMQGNPMFGGPAPIKGGGPLMGGTPEGRVPRENPWGGSSPFGAGALPEDGAPMPIPEGRVPRENPYGGGKPDIHNNYIKYGQGMPQFQTGGFNYQQPMGGFGQMQQPMAPPQMQMATGDPIAQGWTWK